MSNDFLGIDHIGIAVKDLAAAKAAYGELLGFRVSGGERLDDRGLEIVFVETGNSRIELIAPTRPDSEVSAFIDKRGEGLHHLCVRVDDIEKTLADMKARGARLINESPKIGAHGRRVAFVHPKSAAGVLVELVEDKEGAGHH